MARYELCPRCQLNFIDADSEEFCEVCRMEMNGEKTFTDNLDEVETEETETGKRARKKRNGLEERQNRR